MTTHLVIDGAILVGVSCTDDVLNVLLVVSDLSKGSLDNNNTHSCKWCNCKKNVVCVCGTQYSCVLR